MAGPSDDDDTLFVSSQSIRNIRLNMGLTQVEFAEELGVTPITVLRWERGYTRPPRYLVRALELLQKTVTPGWLRKRSRMPYWNSPSAVKLRQLKWKRRRAALLRQDDEGN